MGMPYAWKTIIMDYIIYIYTQDKYISKKTVKTSMDNQIGPI